MTEEQLFEEAQAEPSCPRCEETTEVTVLREWHRPVARGQSVLLFLAAAILVDPGAKLLLGGNAAGALLLVAGALSAAMGVRAAAGDRTSRPVDVIYCRHCGARFSAPYRSSGEPCGAQPLPVTQHQPSG